MNERERLEQLRKEIEQHNYDYYVLSKPTISDVEFDAKMRELEELERRNPSLFDPTSPTQHVGSDLGKTSSKGFQQIAHTYPMLSLSNTYSREEVQDWVNKLPAGVEIVCELKYDGLGISLHYEAGRLIYALTRGDGQKGDNVIENIKTIPSIPLQISPLSGLPSVFEMRGEILMPWSSFEKLNKEREENEESLFANPRNAASGTLKLLDYQEVKRRGLTAFLYYMLGEDLPYSTHFERLQAAKRLGFPISDAIQLCRNMDEVMNFIQFWDVERKKLPVATDGVVLKVNSVEQQRRVGYTAKTPKWAIAYKFQPEQQTSILKKITFQVGRTGVVTPVGILDPVQLSGTVVQRATLHNANFIEQLNLREGDTVVVEKGGEIIPKISSVVQHNSTQIEPFVFPKCCPECGTMLVRPAGEVAWYCPNDTSCPPQQIFKIVHFVHRRAMNIDGLGYEIIRSLFKNNRIHNVADLYQLKNIEIASLPGQGEKSARNILLSIEKSKEQPWEKVLFALGIRMVGETTAKKIARHFPSINLLKQASKEELMQVEDVGEQVACNIISFLQNADNQRLIDRLREAGVQFAAAAHQVVPSTNYLRGEKIVISGVFKVHSRDDYKRIIEEHGGVNVSSVSKNTTRILCGENMGESKRQKAEELGIPLTDEATFLRLIHEIE